jgi:hypothetical protein
MSNDLNRRLGMIKYTGSLLDTNPAELLQLFGAFIPLDLKYDVSDDLYFAKGLSPTFRKVAIGEMIPSYKVIFERDYDAVGNNIMHTVRFEEVI